MIARIFLHLAVFGAIGVAICNGTALNSNEAEARIFLNETSDKLFSFFNEIANIAFDDDAYNLYDQHEANKNYSIFFKKIFDDSRKFDTKNFKNEELKYAFEMLHNKAGEYILGEERYLKLLVSEEELEKLLNEIILVGNQEDILATSNDSAELQYYWSAWRNKTAPWAEKNLNITIEALKEAASLNELSPLEYWSRGYNFTDMENLLAEVRPLYLELHAFIRNLLRKKFGGSIISPDGLIPEYLLDQVTDQAWSIIYKVSIIEEMFPSENLPPVESVMRKKFKAKQLYEIADNFYEKLGFEKYPSSIWGDRIKMDEADDNNCQPRVWRDTPNIHLEFCKKLSFWKLLEAYENMGYIYYAKEMAAAGLPAYYYFKTPIGLEYAIAKAVSLSASTHHNLKAIGMIPDSFDITQAVEMNRLLRIGIRDLLFFPINFVYARVMGDLVSGNVKMSELTSHYWHLMDKYAGIGPPKDYKSHSIDLPGDFFQDMRDNTMSIDFTMKMLCYQIYKKLCELSEKYPKEPLHLCDISGSKEAGNALKKMMRLGSSKPFNEVLATMFPENPTVRAEGLLEYYNPLKDLLVKMNKEANVKLGWKTSDSDKS